MLCMVSNAATEATEFRFPKYFPLEGMFEKKQKWIEFETTDNILFTFHLSHINGEFFHEIRMADCERFLK